MLQFYAIAIYVQKKTKKKIKWKTKVACLEV